MAVFKDCHSFVYLQISVNEVVAVKVFIVISERVEKCLGHFDPPKNAEKFDNGEEWNVDVRAHVFQLVNDRKPQGGIAKLHPRLGLPVCENKLIWSLQELAGK